MVQQKLRFFVRASAVMVLFLSFIAVPSVAADHQVTPAPIVGDDDFYTGEHDHQHGGTDGHLSGSSLNVDLVGKLKLVNFEGDISDVTALESSGDGNWYAYLGDWGAKCQTGGVHIVDISDPSNPVKIGYLNSKGSGYITEGMHALHIDTSEFTGDILVLSNEWCIGKSNVKLNPGGITIWDITDPWNPELLVEAFGDFDLFGNVANESHSAIAWDAGDDAYVAAIDNNETFDDVDIFEITDPRNPVLIAETGLLEWPSAESAANGEEPTAHDMDVLQFPDDSWHLMVSYWDTGWVDLDVTDAHNPTFDGDSTYASCDQVIWDAYGYCVIPEGNAHQGEWNADGSLFIGTDEDFSPYRPNCAINSTAIGCSEFGWAVPLAEQFPSGFSGDTVFGGLGCPGADRTNIVDNYSQAQTGADAIAFLRGACFFSDKVVTGEMAGYDMVIIINSHAGALNGVTPNAHFAGGQGSPVLGTASAVMIGHANGHELFNDAVEFTDNNDLPAIGALGETFSADAGVFDGWGYARLLDTSGGFTEIDQLAIDEAFDPAFAFGYGDLTVHEVEVPRGDPNEGGSNADDGVLAYFSWYAGGFRVAEYDSTGITEVGHYIDPDGNNFWGVALAEDEDGGRIVLASDRDYGLFIFRYTGP